MSQNKIRLSIIRTICFILFIFFLVFGVKAYIWYVAIQWAIGQNNAKYIDLAAQLDFTKNFYIPYLRSDYAGYFVNHEHGFANDHEIIVKFIKKTQVHIPSLVTTSIPDDDTWLIKWWWKEFIEYKLNRSLKR